MDEVISIGGDDDDDEFDWEAAVREIDVACQSMNPSTSHPNGSSFQFPNDETYFQNLANPSSSTSRSFGNQKKVGTSRQSTLDKYVTVVPPRLPIENLIDENRIEEGGDDERGRFVDIDAEAAKTWIYPTNIPLRDYQFDITKKALFSNTLVALPTGLGKTLIAAVVMYNYFRWFPEGKIVFAAPSRPLVLQQIEACHKVVGIPQEWTIDMTGQTNPTKRAGLWKTKRVFFVTPQVLEKDIQSGTCLVKYLVCLVIDEAHRAMGNYSYCVAVRELMAVPLQLRILALTATPGSKQQVIQRVIDNLLISTLEYRDESDPDVSPYVHDRKIELIQVPMGKDAVEINNKLLEVIRPYASKLLAVGVLGNRDYQTLSPCDLLNSRDRFRQAPPPNLPQNKYDEVEKSFQALITMYHIRKLLSSHGIRPAYEMLEEKLKQGYFARLMSRNEDIMQAMHLMQHNLSHGAPNPKLSKMLEVLVDHFKSQDPRNSRVIVFSNFRGSVRDIMDALASIGELVKATEFIGQSSGKTLKGQSQKVQQAVLEKFRAGGFNVIVATSIGEEGLDIMEVDLVICFDANVSPLRMIQRMGRTGRKHDGRVVVLACEGSEIKGYMRKQSSNKALKKHMRNGGMNSFNFHLSPRMIPHMFKPEAHLVEFAINQFVPRGKKLKDDHAVETPIIFDKLTDVENKLLAKYFPSNSGSTWKPSLIAFPSSQSVPSRVHKVMHSSRAGMLIDSMQHLQGLSFSRSTETLLDENKTPSGQCLVDENVEMDVGKDQLHFDDILDEQSERETSDYEASPRGVLQEEKHSMPEINASNPPVHSYIFGSDFVSVNELGQVHIHYVPSFPFKGLTNLKDKSAISTMSKNCLEQDSCHLKTSAKNYEQITHANDVADLETSYQTRCTLNEAAALSEPFDSDLQQEKTLHEVEIIPETPISKRIRLNVDSTSGTNHAEIKGEIMEDDDYGNDFRDIELSPRLTNFIESGVVPESPPVDVDQHSSPKRLSEGEGGGSFLGAEPVSPAKLCTEQQTMYTSPQQKENVILEDNTAMERNILVTPINNGFHTPDFQMKNSSRRRVCTSTSPIVEKTRTPLANVGNSCSSEWLLSSEDKSLCVKKAPKFRRLRKIGDCENNRGLKSVKENSVAAMGHVDRPLRSPTPTRNKNGRGKKKQSDDVKVFIEEEAEVSLEAEVSDDDEDDLDDNSYEDSFIDDRINPSAASTQADSSRVDMMAVYRRSLFSQSPLVKLPACYATNSPDSVATIKSSEVSGGSSSGKTSYSVQTPQVGSTDQFPVENSESHQGNTNRTGSEAIPGLINISTGENEMVMENRKRKSSFLQPGYTPTINLEQKFLSSLQVEAEKSEAKEDPFSDDLFYEGLDLDAVEAQATLLLKQRSEMASQKPEVVPPKQGMQHFGVMDAPSFDLGF